MQPFSYLNLAAGTTLAPRERTAAGSETGTTGTATGTTTGTTTGTGEREHLLAIGLTEPQFAPGRRDEPVQAPGPEPVPPTLPATKQGRLRSRLFLIDLATVLGSWVGLGYALVPVSGTMERLAPGLAAAVVTLLAMQSVGLYRARLCSRKVEEFRKIILCGLWGAAAFVVVQHHFKVDGHEVLICAGTYVAILVVFRWQYGRWLRAQRAQGRWLRGVVLVGSNHDAAQLATMLRSEPELGYLVTGVIGECDDPYWDSLPTSPSICSIPHLAAATDASGVLIVPYALSSVETQSAMAVAAASNLHVQVWPGWPGIGNQRLRQTPLSDEPFFYVEPGASARWQTAVKRAVDVIGASVILLLTAPIVGLAALLIKMEDGGPVFHRGERVGRHGKTILVYKLRSMTPNDGEMPPDLAHQNERVDGPLFKMSNDPRVTKVGRILRASSIDEIPQLLNVLQGTMSLVGPRPALPSEAAQFDEDLQRRHSVLPGITGLWQVEARHNPSFNAYRRLDLRYVDNWSIWLDLNILVSTVPSVASQAINALRKSRRA
jgi:exopolysaccharide biosynthesis polyprenyl glycosylphosphotransferase